jgi:putative Holliday junction resolvase
VGRILGLDLGTRTIGIAISDSTELIASAIETYRFKEDDFESALRRVEEIVKEKNVYKIVLGYPKHMNGDVGDKALLCADFGNKLKELLGVDVILEDERWTTKLATNRLLEFDLSRNKRKKIIDKMAAVVILQNYLDGHKGGK